MREAARPLLRYHGGKWRLAPWLLNHFPPHLNRAAERWLAQQPRQDVLPLVPPTAEAAS